MANLKQWLLERLENLLWNLSDARCWRVVYPDGTRTYRMTRREAVARAKSAHGRAIYDDGAQKQLKLDWIHEPRPVPTHPGRWLWRETSRHKWEVHETTLLEGTDILQCESLGFDDLSDNWRGMWALEPADLPAVGTIISLSWPSKTEVEVVDHCPPCEVLAIPANDKARFHWRNGTLEPMKVLCKITE